MYVSAIYGIKSAQSTVRPLRWSFSFHSLKLKFFLKSAVLVLFAGKDAFQKDLKPMVVNSFVHWTIIFLFVKFLIVLLSGGNKGRTSDMPN